MNGGAAVGVGGIAVANVAWGNRVVGEQGRWQTVDGTTNSSHSQERSDRVRGRFDRLTDRWEHGEAESNALRRRKLACNSKQTE